MIKSAIAVTLIAVAGAASAAGTSKPVPPAKQELVQRVLQLWQVEALAQSMLQDSVTDAVGQARAVLQARVPAERRDAVMREVATDAKKFLDENGPVVRASAQKLVPSTVAPMLAEKFTEEELRQIIAMLESPVKKKFEEMVPEMQKALGAQVAAESRTVIDPKLDDFRQRISSRLRTAITP
ncbi:hypothetical protein [Noviherbaspirillum denitrificans]|uniref:DUF2059 domain-containing protein n=1 Tax=Noviherbaspirillum denitrificans TaxID=1968433 RepID=A0A254TEK7_9BURK|nr:hypothetical protein [Noviherbaspirillum denitrificans]OWW21034.1 hypothetical protein AYR66_17695 [Noviherbaspirillum denitrificans]